MRSLVFLLIYFFSWCTFSWSTMAAQLIEGHRPISGSSIDNVKFSAMARCVKLPKPSEMIREIEAHYKNQSQRSYAALDLDHLIVNGPITYPQVEDLKTLTSPPEIYQLASLADRWKNVESVGKNGALRIRRYCGLWECRERGIEFSYFNLSHVNSENCTTQLCAVQHLFGKQEGIVILWAYLKYGLMMSPYVKVDAQKLDLITLKSIVVALQLLPLHLRAQALEAHFFRAPLTVHPPGTKVEQQALATPDGALYDGFFKLSVLGRVEVILHEMGHLIGRYVNLLGPLSERDISTEWRQASGWSLGEYQIDRQIPQEKNYVSIGAYAGTAVREDFAEALLMYRADPHALLEKSPSRYEYLREYVFEGIEYTDDVCGRNSSPR